MQLDKDLTVAVKKILPAVTPDVCTTLLDPISDISSKTRLEIVANRKEQGGISIPSHNAARGKQGMGS